MKTKKFLAILVTVMGLGLFSSCCDHDHKDPWRYEDEYIDVETRYTLSGEVSVFAEYNYDYLILGMSKDNKFIVIGLANEGANNNTPNVQERTLLPLEQLHEEIDFLNQTSKYHFEYTAEPCIYESDIYWRVSSDVRGVYAIVNHFGKSFIIDDDFYYNENIRYEFLSELGFHFWTPYSKDYYIRIRSRM